MRNTGPHSLFSMILYATCRIITKILLEAERTIRTVMIELTCRLGFQWTVHWTTMEDVDDGLEQKMQ
jgi:hypothetical protein